MLLMRSLLKMPEIWRIWLLGENRMPQNSQFAQCIYSKVVIEENQTVVSLFPQGIRSKTSNGCLKSDRTKPHIILHYRKHTYL